MPLQPGQVLNNRYHIDRLLGHGGFGAVHLAWDLNLKVQVAVKESLDASPLVEKQFMSEARLLHTLHQPNLPRVYDFFIVPNQALYLVMDYSTATAHSTTLEPIVTVNAAALEPSVPPANAQPGDTWTRLQDGMKMVYIPVGEFLMGSADSDQHASSDEKPQHTVFLDSYWIDQTEVTNAMFRLFVMDRSHNWDGTYVGDNDYPVVTVSWYDAVAYCDWVGGNLPTEAQWEKAARGADGRLYPWGDQPASCEYAVIDDGGNGCGKKTAWPVGSKSAGASPYGLLDMAGNAWEWVLDWYDSSYYIVASSNNPTGPGSGDGRVLRGGSWGYVSWYARTASRSKYDPADHFSSIGFRCAR